MNFSRVDVGSWLALVVNTVVTFAGKTNLLATLDRTSQYWRQNNADLLT